MTDAATLDHMLWLHAAAAVEILWTSNSIYSDGRSNHVVGGVEREWLLLEGITAGRLQNKGGCRI